MKILHGQQLVNELRRLSDKVSKRLWIAVPYIGNLKSIRQILGKHWFDSPSVNVKLLTDVSDITCIDTETLQLFHDRGEIKTLLGLHAKIYIIDNACLVTSANLTNTAFSKRHEIGILCDKNEAMQIINIFNTFWKISESITLNHLNKIFKTKRKSHEETGISLPISFELPSDPGSFSKNLEKRFLNYDRLVADYDDFAKKYSSVVQRIWKGVPLHFEIDQLFNYLYHEAPKTPSKSFDKKSPRNLTSSQQITEIKKWSTHYNQWIFSQTGTKSKRGKHDIDWMSNNSKTKKIACTWRNFDT